MLPTFSLRTQRRIHTTPDHSPPTPHSTQVEELKVALKRLQEMATAHKAHVARTRVTIAALRDKAKGAEEVAAVTKVCEDAADKLVAFQNSKGVGALLGDAMLRKNIKAADIVSKWDANGDGIDRQEFRKGLIAINAPGVEAAEADALFESLDVDRSGSLDSGEVQQALKTLTAEAEGARTLSKTLSLALVETSKALQESQKGWRQRCKEDEEAEAAKEEALRQQRMAVVRAAGESEAKKQANKRAAAEKAAADKAAFDAKVAARRGTGA